MKFGIVLLVISSLTGMISSCKQADQFITKNTLNTKELSVFQLYSGKYCEVETTSGSRMFNCENLSNFLDADSDDCAKLGGSALAYFPDQSRPMHLCRQDASMQLRSDQHTVRFTMYGDVGVGEDRSKGHYQMTVAQAMLDVCPPDHASPAGDAKTCDFALVAGDLIYPDGIRDVWDQQLETKFERIYGIFGRYDIYAVPGNHDYHGNIQAAVDYTHFSDRWRILQRSFSVPKLPSWMSIVGVDTSPIMEENKSITAQTWAAINDGCRQTDGVNFLFGHHPLITHGKHGSEPEMGPVLDQFAGACPIHFYLAGHDHHQEHVFSDGIDLIVQGGGGAETHGVDLHPNETRQLALASGSRSYVQRYAKNANGFSVIEVTKEAADVVVQVYFYAVTIDGGPITFDDHVYKCRWRLSQAEVGCVPKEADDQLWLTNHDQD